MLTCGPIHHEWKLCKNSKNCTRNIMWCGERWCKVFLSLPTTSLIRWPKDPVMPFLLSILPISTWLDTAKQTLWNYKRETIKSVSPQTSIFWLLFYYFVLFQCIINFYLYHSTTKRQNWKLLYVLVLKFNNKKEIYQYVKSYIMIKQLWLIYHKTKGKYATVLLWCFLHLWKNSNRKRQNESNHRRSA